MPDRDFGNTSVFEHSGKYYATAENKMPIEIDIQTLQTLGNWEEVHQTWSRPFTSHPKVAYLFNHTCNDLYIKKIIQQFWFLQFTFLRNFIMIDVTERSSNRRACCSRIRWPKTILCSWNHVRLKLASTLFFKLCSD